MTEPRLHPEQDYVLKIAAEIGVTPKILHHQADTKTCLEKLELLKKENPTEFSDWNLNRIVKALYFSKDSSPLIGIITPELGEKNVDQKEVFSRLLWKTNSDAERYWTNPKHLPHGMAWGTCTPFPVSSDVGSRIVGLIFVEHKPIWDQEVNISIGGTSRNSFLTSMHIPYGAIYEILRRQFGDDRIRLYKPNS